jgi:hypothetical protein
MMKISNLTTYIRPGTFALFLLCFNTLSGQVNFAQDGEKDAPTVSLFYHDTLSIPSFTEFSIPVIMKTGHEVSAISLGFYFPQEYLEVTGVEMADGAQGYSYSTTDSLLMIAWSSVTPINILDDGTVVTLKMKSIDLSALSGTIKLGIFKPSEFADQSANVIEAVILEIPEIQYLQPDTSDSLDGNYILVYPNPFKEFTTINFYLKADSKVKISVFNPAGMKILQMPDSDYPQGTYQVYLHAVDFSKGIYVLKFEAISEENSSSKLIKILVIR